MWRSAAGCSGKTRASVLRGLRRLAVLADLLRSWLTTWLARPRTSLAKKLAEMCNAGGQSPHQGATVESGDDLKLQLEAILADLPPSVWPVANDGADIVMTRWSL